MEHEEVKGSISGIFRPPMSKDELHGHIVVALLAFVRQLHFMFCVEGFSCSRMQANLLGLEDAPGIADPDVDAGELGLSYENIRRNGFAEEMNRLYDFAYLGMYLQADDFNSESGASWVSRILFDMSKSSYFQEWHEYSKCSDAIEALLKVCETAQARISLEYTKGWKHDGFMDWHVPSGCGEGQLTFRQMSLLSGMSESSLRTMANPKHKNPLKTVSDGRNAFIDADHAREWLISKGRYIHLITTNSQGATIDLLVDDIRSIDALQLRLDQRLQFLLAQDEADEVRADLAALDPKILHFRLSDGVALLAIDDLERFNDKRFLGLLAKALRLPAHELTLKSKQLFAIAELSEIERKLNDAKQRRNG